MAQEEISYRSPSYFEIANSKSSTWRDYRDERYREYRRKWDEHPRRRYPGEFPLHLDLDTTNACNLKCVMCPRTHFIKTHNRKWAPNGRIGFMDFDLFRRLVDQAAAEGAYSIKMNYLGEPLLHPRVVNQIRYAHDRGLEVMMNTNATLLNEIMSHRILEAGLDDIFFSVDSPYPEEYERIRVGADFHQVIGNISNFIRIKDRLGYRHVQTRVSMVLDWIHRNDRKIITDYRSLFNGLGVDEIGFGLPTDMNTDYWTSHGRVPGFVCRDIYSRMFVFWDGLIGPCCGEWERGYILGDARSDRLKDVWTGERYRTLREAHEQGHYERIPICRACSVPWLSQQEVPI